MGSRDKAYTTKNYMTPDGDAYKIGGALDLLDTATSTVDAAAAFTFFDSASYTGTLLRNIFRSAKTTTLLNTSTGSTVLSDLGGSSPPVLPSEYGNIVISATATLTDGSCRLFSAQMGMELYIGLSPLTVASVQSLRILCEDGTGGITGAKVFGSARTTPISTIALRNSANSYAWVKLRAVKDGTWQIIAIDGDVTEVLSA